MMIALRPFHHPLISLFFLAADILLIWATVTIAVSKGRNGLFWGIVAFFIPLITLIVIALVPPTVGTPSSKAA
jgi:hypothetical protein